jgi:hypothetical protein
LGIDVVQPKRISKLERTPKPEQPNRSYYDANTVQTAAHIEGMSRGDTLDQCVFKSKDIICAGVRYQLMGNLANKKLAEGVLERSNRMNIPVYLGEPGDKAALGHYLSQAYGQYVEKMLEIGLGGSTFSYAKFVYLYQDVTDKNIDFSGRFETMFGYLKQDKQQLAVSEKLPNNVHISKEYCGWSGDKTVVCDGGQKNYLYRRQH